MLHLIDAVSLAGSRTRPNEDFLGRAADRVWVIDGATGLGDPIVSAASDAAWLAALASECFSRHARLADTRAMMAAVAANLDAAFRSERSRPPQERWEIPCASFLMLTDRGAAGCEIAWLGDCRVILRSEDSALMAFGATAESEAREAGFVARHAIGDPAARYREPGALAALRVSRARYNEPGMPAILAPESGFAPKVRIERLALKRPAQALLMTDGFAALELRYGHVATADFILAAQADGLAATGARLRAIEEKEDPDGTRFPRWKRSDDATAALVLLG